MDETKKVKLFKYLDSPYQSWAKFHTSFNHPERENEGFIKIIGKRLLPANPNYGHIYKRINKLNIDIKKDNMNDDDNDDCVILDKKKV